ncbi:MAG: anthranilate synthase component I [Methyloligella sp. ZOD6]
MTAETAARRSDAAAGDGAETIRPGFDAFAKAYDADKPQVVWTRLVADLETPVSAFLKLAHERPNSFLLESVEGGATRGRYSIIGCDPDLIWRVQDAKAEIDRAPDAGGSAFAAEALPPLDSLRALLKESAIDLPRDLPPMAAGIFGYMGYDTVRLIEDLPNDKPDPLSLPTSLMVRPRMIVIFDSVRDEMTLVTPVRPAPEQDASAAYDMARARLEDALAKLERPLPHQPQAEGAAEAPAPQSATAPESYMKKVEAAKDYITAGDIFQVVLSQRFEAPFPLSSFALYRALRRVNPSPYLYYLNFGDFAVVGSSPEILVRVRDETVTIRPIAGTRPRGATPEEDDALAQELLADAKERAEHLMLLDLGRNDVGRVAEVGSVSVTDSFFLEYYSQVMHIVSNVEGKLDKRHDAIDALMAGFPAGTVSGAPKVRAMQIIDELEDERRGPYAGCVGYFSANGEMDSCIVLRTSVIKDGKMYVQAGAGLVADSVPEKEQAECVSKAKALFQAAEEAVRFSARDRRGG